MDFSKFLKRNSMVFAPEDESGAGGAPETVEKTEAGESDTDPKEPPARGATAFYKEQAEKMKQQLEKMQSEVGQYKTQLELKEEEKLREQNKWQELAEKYKRERDEVNNTFSSFKGSMVEFEKLNAVKQAALKAGIVDASIDDLELMTLEGVDIETTSSGRLIVHGHEDFVERLKDMRPHWFKNNRPPNVNNDIGDSYRPREMSMNDILKLQKDNPAEYKKQMQKILDKRRSAQL